jgi:hypothetical protein
VRSKKTWAKFFFVGILKPTEEKKSGAGGSVIQSNQMLGSWGREHHKERKKIPLCFLQVLVLVIVIMRNIII